MATIIKNQAGEYEVKPGDSLSRIASTQGRTLQELLSLNPQYRAPTPTGATNSIYPGQKINLGAQASNTPSYSNLVAPPAPTSSGPSLSGLMEGAGSGQGYVPPALKTNDPSTTTSFTKALIGILKEAQGTNQTGQAKLMKQSQDIKGQALADSAKVFNNKYLAPSSGTSLGLSAQGEFDPATLSIENQQKLATANLGNITDIIDRTQESYDSEADRALEERKLSQPDTNQMTDNERALLSTFVSSPIVKDYNMVISQKNYADRIIKNGVGGPADLALVFSFMKGLDPNSVVRETEYDNAAKSGNIFAGAFAKFNGYLKPEGGFLPESVQQEFQNLVNQKLYAQQVQYNNFANEMRKIAINQGLNPDNVVLNLSGGIDTSAAETKVIDGATYERVNGGWQKVSFNSVGGDTNAAIRSVDDAMGRIARNESAGSGGYTAVGPVVTSGMYAGQRALGKYQVMPGNLPEWSKLALGRVVTPEEFMNNPALQEQIVRDQMVRNYNKYGNWNDVASVWFTGRPAATGANRRDTLGTTGAQYVAKFNA